MDESPVADYSMPVTLRILIDGYVLGLDRIYHFDDIRNDPLITAKHDLERLPDQSVLRKDLRKHFQSDEDVNHLREIKAKQVRGVLKRMDGPLVLEFDSTVETVYGSQEGACVGYNPAHHGRASYHLQLCREGRTGLNLWSRLRPGNTVSSTDFVQFLDECWMVIPKRFKRKNRNGLCDVLTREDSGYENEDILRWHEERCVGYVVKMTMKGNVWAEVMNIAVDKIETFSALYNRGVSKFRADFVIFRYFSFFRSDFYRDSYLMHANGAFLP